MVPAGLALAIIVGVAAHSNSEGKSRFDVARDGTVDVEVQLSALDLPELCNVELSVKARAEQEERLDVCLKKGAPFWLRVSDGPRACSMEMRGWRFLEPRTNPEVIAFNMQASCGARIQTLVIDWGLFSGAPLDHTSVARILVAGDEPRLFSFSKRARKLTLELGSGVQWWVVAGVVSLLGVACAAGVISARRRARG